MVSKWTEERLLCSGEIDKVTNLLCLATNRLIAEIEPTDHPLGGTRQFIVWAKGQTKVRKGEERVERRRKGMERRWRVLPALSKAR